MLIFMENNGFKIESGIPIPSKSGDSRYPFREMKVGDSFFVPGKKAANLAGCLGYYRTRYKITLVTRTVDGGVRVWRTE